MSKRLDPQLEHACVALHISLTGDDPNNLEMVPKYVLKILQKDYQDYTNFTKTNLFNYLNQFKKKIFMK